MLPTTAPSTASATSHVPPLSAPLPPAITFDSYLSSSSSASFRHRWQFVTDTRIDVYSSYWQSAFSDISAFFAANAEGDEEEDILTHAADALMRNTVVTDNYRSMLIVLCMSLEQYPSLLLQQKEARREQATRSNAAVRRGEDEQQQQQQQQRVEPVHIMFERLYRRGRRRGSNTIATTAAVASSPATHPPSSSPSASFSPLSPPSSSSSSAAALYATEQPPQWLLNLLFIAQCMLSHVVQMEYGERRERLWILLSNRQAEKRRTAAAAAATAAVTAATEQLPLHPSCVAASSLHSDLSYRLVHSLISFLTLTPLTHATAEPLQECTQLLLLLCCSQCYAPLSPLYANNNNVYLTHILCGIAREKTMAERIVGKLLQLTLSQSSLRTHTYNSANARPHTDAAAAVDASAATIEAQKVPDNTTPAAGTGTAAASTAPAAAKKLAVIVDRISPSSPSSSSSSPPTQKMSSPRSPVATRHSSSNNNSSSSNSGSSSVAHSRRLHLLRSLGSRIVHLLLLPVQKLYRYIVDFSSSSAAAAAVDKQQRGLADPLADSAYTLLLLLLQQSMRSFVTVTGEEEGVEDEQGKRWRVQWMHECERGRERHATEEEWQLWREEEKEEEEEEQSATARATASSSAHPPLSIVPPSSSSSSSPPPPPLLQQDINPFLSALSQLRDAADDDLLSASAATAATAAAAVAAPRPSSPLSVDFSSLYRFVCSAFSCSYDCGCLLLYTLLSSAAAFREYVLSKSDADSLLLPLLRFLHTATGANSIVAAAASSPSSVVAAAHLHTQRVYLTLILLLQLSTDRGFISHLHLRVTVPAEQLRWYTDASLPPLSLGSLCLLLLLRTAHTNLYTHKDAYVHSNALAILSNVAMNHDVLSAAAAATAGTVAASDSAAASATATVVSLHPSVCHKLLSLLEVLSKRYSKLQVKEQEERTRMLNEWHSRFSSPASSPSSSSAASPSQQQQQQQHHQQHDDSSLSSPTVVDLSSLTSLLRLLLDLLLFFLSRRYIRSNIYLLYSLLQSRSSLQFYLRVDDSDLQLRAQQLEALCEWFSARIDRERARVAGVHMPDAAAAAAGAVAGPYSSALTSASAPASLPHPSAYAHVTLSVEATMELLQSECKHWRNYDYPSSSSAAATATTAAAPSASAGPPFPSLSSIPTYSYAAAEDSDEFFLSFLWQSCYMRGKGPPSSENVVLFPTGDSEGEPEEQQEEKEQQLQDVDANTAVGAEEDTHDELDAAEMEQQYREHALQQQLGSAAEQQQEAVKLHAQLQQQHQEQRANGHPHASTLLPTKSNTAFARAQH